MVDLKACLEAAGLTDVKTYLQSGNVIFASEETDGAKLRHQIEVALTATFHYDAIVLVYPFDSLAALVEAYPFGPQEEHHSYVVFVTGEEDFASPLAAADTTQEQVKLGLGCIYWQVPRGLTLDSPFAKQLNTTKLKPHNTVRNINTLRKMLL